MPNERCVWVCGLQATNPARQSCTNEEMRGEKDLQYKRPESFNVFIDLHNLVRNQSIMLLFHAITLGSIKHNAISNGSKTAGGILYHKH